MRDREMPPRSARTRPSDAEIAIVREWIANGASGPDEPERKRGFVTDRMIEVAIHRDLEAQPQARRAAIRYVSLVHLYNAGASEDELTLVRQGLIKLLASLTWSPRLYVPRAIDAHATLYRIELDQLGWTDKTWETIASHDPYGVARTTTEARAIRAYTGSLRPFLRADWLIATASVPPLYHEILEIPEQVASLERRLDVDVDRDVRDSRVLRAGFNRSGVSQNNRVIERHALTGGGYYWQSHDFQSSADERNIFALPLEFRRDGGEIIFSLPNGMQGYMIVDAGGRRLDKAPTVVVADPSRPDRAVTSGVSCMGCHSRGIIAKKDEIRQHVIENRRAFERSGSRSTYHPRGSVRDILAIYPPADTLQAAFTSDSARFESALTRLGVDAVIEPINVATQRFEAELDLARAAAELGLPASELASQLAKQGDLRRKLGVLLVGGGTVKRDAFVAIFALATSALARGLPMSELSSAEKLDLVCDTGSIEACLAAGVAFHHGSDVAVDHRRSSQLFERACNAPRDSRASYNSDTAERAEGCRLLGHAFYRGHGVARDRRRALALYQKACGFGSAEACGHAGFVHASGVSVAADPVQGGQFYARACQLGQGSSCLTLGNMFYNGLGIARNRGRAAFYFDHACTRGVASGCTQAGRQYRWGTGVRVDWIRSYRSFRRGCDLGDKAACAEVLDLAKLVDLR